MRRVYITDDAELLPPYLRFVRGVVDSEDMPLNISREMLQNNPQVAQIRKALTGRVHHRAGKPCRPRTPETFAKIWEVFGPVLKEGIYEDHERRDQLLGLCRFATTAGDSPRSLKQYVADLKPNQTEIYYLVGESAERLKSNPKLEAARARGIEVLLLTDPVDALWTSMPLGFEGKPLKSLSQGEVDFGLVPMAEQAKRGDAKSAPDAVDEATVLAAVKSALGEQVSEVRASQRLTDSAPAWWRRPPAPIASSSGCLPVTTAAPASSRSSSSTCGTRSSRPCRTPSRPSAPTRLPTFRRCCSTRRKSSTARCRTIRPRSPAGSTGWSCADWAEPRNEHLVIPRPLRRSSG